MARTTLFCFHHAGGSEWQFRSWSSRLSPAIKVVGVPLECRTGEPQTIEQMAARARNFLAGEDIASAAFYGHSMGGLVAFEVCRQLSAAGLELPAAVILGGSPPPGTLPASEEALRILDETEPLPAFLPAYITERMEAGVRRACAYSPPRDKIPTQLDVICGTTDNLVNFRRMQQWEDYCDPAPRYHQVVGGHLFHRSAQDDFMTVLRQLIPCNALPAGTAAAS
ncbi:thioesterase II family protein [Paenarthrobacter sp. NPDC058040]|uniref:thioesterase II family protein n=1 Tax=unclassified Paenarthrobacter TaxID=2634190 RepID=UPI0036D94DE2